MKITRIAPGAYEAHQGGEVAFITRVPELGAGPQWITAASWDKYCVTDPLWTLADAKEQAQWMLTERLAP